MTEQPQELARIRASAPRRVIGVSVMSLLGALVLYVGMAVPPQNLLWQIFLLVAGVSALLVAQLMWRATALDLVLTKEALTDTAGEELARLDNIARVERSAFAMKPSNGFLIVLKSPEKTVWRPGLWWRMGRRVAIGGVTAGSQTKPVADMILMRLQRPNEAE
jgi:hypothetical protein